jgi:PilZ domain-containing protein
MAELEVQVPAGAEKVKSNPQRKAARALVPGLTSKSSHLAQQACQPDGFAPLHHEALETSEKAGPERRRETRHKGPRQVWIQATDAQGANIEEIQVMRDYSRGGFYFVTSLHCYSVGMRLNVIPSFGSLNLEFVAEVVRVEPKRNMAYGVGVKLLHARDPIGPQNCA